MKRRGLARRNIHNIEEAKEIITKKDKTVYTFQSIPGTPFLVGSPVLMLTSLGERKDVTRGLALGASGYITKPVLPSTLLEAVETLIGG